MSEYPSNHEQDQLPRNQIFTSRLEQRFFAWYHRVFSIAEIESTLVLQWVFGALLLTCYITFFDLVRSSAITIEAYAANAYSCWPYFQSCGEYYFLSTLPYGYTQPMLYSFFFGIMTLIVFLMWKKDWVLAHFLLLLIFAWKFFVLFFLTASMSGNYDYYDIILAIVLLFLPHKHFFLRLTFVMLYFLAATTKIHEGWILGTYFTALETGLPIFSEHTTPLITNLVIFMQIVGAWFLLSANQMHQRLALIYFLCFHFYSGILVYYRYLTTAIPMLLILFGPFNTAIKTPSLAVGRAGWAFLILLTAWQFIPHTIEGDQRMTLEGNRFGLYMFEANHQCVSEFQTTLTDGTVTATSTRESVSARNRCDPYHYWFRLYQACQRYENVESIRWTFDHSINGGPFYRIVDTENACNLQYHPLKHNSWIQLPEAGAPVMGYPVKNYYY